jgi:hypothetical protein
LAANQEKDVRLVPVSFDSWPPLIFVTSIAEEVPNMEALDIYRHEPDGSFSWITTVNSMKMARMIIRSSASNALEEFLIRDDHTNESITLRADGRWFHKKIEQNSPNQSCNPPGGRN